MRRDQKLSGMLLILFFISGFTALTKQDTPIGLEPGKTLPTFKLPNLDGKEIALQEFHGRIVIIHLWKCQ